MKLKSIVAAAVLASGSLVASAATSTYQVGGLLSGTGSAVQNFATLSVSSTDNQLFSYTLTLADNFSSLFGTNGAYIGALAVNASPDVVGGVRKLPSIVDGSISGGVSTVDVSGANGPLALFEFRYNLGQGADKLKSGETVTWSSSFLNVPTSFENMAVHVQGLGGGESQWYSLTPVPEPETYAMFLAGLGLLGAVARRRMR